MKFVDDNDDDDCIIEHRPGRLHCNADGVSRHCASNAMAKLLKRHGSKSLIVPMSLQNFGSPNSLLGSRILG